MILKTKYYCPKCKVFCEEKDILQTKDGYFIHKVTWATSNQKYQNTHVLTKVIEKEKEKNNDQRSN